MEESFMEESFVVEDGASGSIEALFTDMDTTTPVTELLDTEAWSCVACEQLDTDLNGDGVIDSGCLRVSGSIRVGSNANQGDR